MDSRSKRILTSRVRDVISAGNAERHIHTAFRLRRDVLDHVSPDFTVGNNECLIVKGEPELVEVAA